MTEARKSGAEKDAPAPACAPNLRAIGISAERDFDLTLKQVATMSGLSVRTLRAFIAAGELGCVRHNERVVTIPIDEWRRYREAHRVRPKPRKIPVNAASRHNSSLQNFEQRSSAA